jgi:nucleoside-diphosphate-sugar epimerase
MSDDRRTVVVTGASGVVGRAVMQALSEDSCVIALVGSDRSVEADEVAAVDLSKSWLGLRPRAWRELAARADAVVHSGALTAWGQAPEVYCETNINGTRRVLQLAEAARAPMYFVGTCFVHAIERGAFELLSDSNVVAPYIWSKLQAERLIESGTVPFTIFRPTNIVGDSRTGASSRPQIVQMMSDWICRGRAPFIPAHPGNRVDIVALDAVAQAVAEAVRREVTGELFWITQGEAAMSQERSLELLVEHAGVLGHEIEQPPVVDPTKPLPVPLEQVPARSRTFLKVLLDVSEVTHHCGGVLPDSNLALAERLGVEQPSDELSFMCSLRYWAHERGQLSSREEVRA